MTIEERISCCYADAVYLEYQKMRYGINNCLESKELEELQDLKDIYEHYLLTETYTGCDISKIIELINRI